MAAPVRASLWAAAAALLAAAGCSPPPEENLGLPEGYVVVRAKGGEVYCRKGEERLAESVAAALADYRRKAGPQVEQLSAEFREVSKAWKEASAGSGKLEAAHRELLAMIRPLVADPEREQYMQQVRRQLVATIANVSSEKFLRAWAGACSGQRAKLVSLDEVKADKVPFLSWVGGRDNPYQWSVQTTRNLDTGGDILKDQKGRMVELTSWALAMPVVREDLAAKGPAAYLDARLDSLRGIAKEGPVATLLGAARARGKPPEGQPLVMMLLHEEAELALVFGLKLQEPLARWFHDGLATVLAQEAVRRAYGRVDPDLLYGPANFDAEYKARRGDVNLLAWTRSDVQGLCPHPGEEDHRDAHYAWSAHELRGLIERHGWEKMQKLLEALCGEKAVSTEVICSKIKDLTGEDLMARLQSFCPKDQMSLEELKAAALKAAAENKAEEALALAERLAASHPRDPLGHLMIAVANGYLWGEERLGRTRREMLIWWYLSDSKRWDIEGLDNEKSSYATARFAELTWPSRPELFKDHYVKALALNPKYEPARARLKALGLGDQEIDRLVREAARKPGLFDKD